LVIQGVRKINTICKNNEIPQIDDIRFSGHKDSDLLKFLRNGTVTIWSTVLCSESNVNGRSRKTSGWVATKGKLPAVVARKPASCLKFRSETAVVDPPSVLRRFRSAFHSFIDM